MGEEKQEVKLPRAIRRGHIRNMFGMNLPTRPFNNRGNTCKRKGKHSRMVNELKKRIYEGIRQAVVRREAKEQSL